MFEETCMRASGGLARCRDPHKCRACSSTAAAMVEEIPTALSMVPLIP